MTRIVVLDGYAACPDDPDFACYRVLDEETVVYARTAKEETAARIVDAQAVLTNKVLITRPGVWHHGDQCPRVFDAGGRAARGRAAAARAQPRRQL